MDSRGTTIWNLCTRLRRHFESGSNAEIPLILHISRVFSFLLLDCALENGSDVPNNLLRLMKVGVKAGKSFIGKPKATIYLSITNLRAEAKQFDLALKVFEKTGGYELKLKRPETHLSSDDNAVCERLIAEYYILRTALVCIN
jgi:hypothetical protein